MTGIMNEMAAALRQLVHDFELCSKLCFMNKKWHGEFLHEAICKGACAQS